uniref:Uncharacterized protein n=1 Tax=Rousettus aegyptiacus TaxID=9407 RepID=A0A7J8H291_ROUAE|nr:hypothetical protein HJG63_011306 [Rousettus aegyptiacus]
MSHIAKNITGHHSRKFSTSHLPPRRNALSFLPKSDTPSIAPVVFKLGPASDSPGGLTKKMLGPSPRVSVSVGLGWGPITCISTCFPVTSRPLHTLRSTAKYAILYSRYRIIYLAQHFRCP